MSSKGLPPKEWGGCPRLVAAGVTLTYAALLGVYVERWQRLASREAREDVLGADRLVPNYHHINNHRDPLYNDQGKSRELNAFGRDFVRLYRDVAGGGSNESAVWPALCRLDSDGDGISNGMELGDPCCRWQPAPPRSAFVLDHHAEYRRWCISEPARDRADPYWAKPASCDPPSYNSVEYWTQYRWFYYLQVRTPVEGYPIQAKHVIGACSVALLFLYWFVYEGLFVDVFLLWSPRKRFGLRTWVLVNVAAFLFMDLTSGIAHLCLDYMPNWIPMVGCVANGFQEHHRVPALLARKPLWNQLNDVFILAPLGAMFLLASKPTRVLRLFWFWAILYVGLFLMAHPWAHMHKDMLPLPVQVAQAWGVLLDQAAHMRHHQDLESQFTILSGHADLVIDTLSQIVPPQRYDLWLFIFISWVLSPIYLNMCFRDRFEKFEAVLYSGSMKTEPCLA
uniref:Lipid desaturase domain-containing protein n=1 Tax=Pyrodinium bahamense TaxID=73915 RepID=A0A7S0FH52_9DINO|mmetsp:Transcript_31188/g.85797  ORF Transcript_31188/g.85797 Transcript_31188/m.85797 type:complete len:451 (+) Transcript_31188:76-1428(+)